MVLFVFCGCIHTKAFQLSLLGFCIYSMETQKLHSETMQTLHFKFNGKQKPKGENNTKENNLKTCFEWCK